MTGRATSQRLLLLLFVLTGVAAMHTIGQPLGLDHCLAGHAVLTTPGGHGSGPTGAMADGGVPAGGRSTDGRTDEPDSGMVMSPLNVCLAVLVGGILLLLAAALRRMRRGGPHEHHIAPTVARTGRGPPAPMLLGLTLADLSVQRT